MLSHGTMYELSLEEIHFGNPVHLEKLIAVHFGKGKNFSIF